MSNPNSNYESSQENEVLALRLPAFEIPASSRKQIAEIHASKWSGEIEDLGSGGWVQTLLQSVAGASNTLRASHCHYQRRNQVERYGIAQRSISAESVQAWASQNLSNRSNSFSLAISGSVTSHKQTGDSHAWLCLQRFDQQSWLCHLRLRSQSRQEQQMSLGLFVIELLHALLLHAEDNLDGLSTVWQEWIEIDLWQALHQPAFENYQSAAKLVQMGWAELVLLKPQQDLLQPVRYLDHLRGQKVLWHKGAFNPVTLAHLEMPQQVLSQQTELQTVLEISLNHFDKAARDLSDLAHQLAMLAYQPWLIALSRMPAFYRSREWLEKSGQVRQSQFVCGQDLWERILMPAYYQNLEGGLAEGLKRLFDQQTQIWVCEREAQSTTSILESTLPLAYQSQVQFLDFQLPIASSQIRQAIKNKFSPWKQDLLPAVADYIETHQLYRVKT